MTTIERLAVLEQNMANASALLLRQSRLIQQLVLMLAAQSDSIPGEPVSVPLGAWMQ